MDEKNVIGDVKKAESEVKSKVTYIESQALSFGQKWWWAVAAVAFALGVVVGLSV